MQLNRAHWMLTIAVTGLLATQLYAAADRTATIQYTAAGEVRLPDYRRWVFIGSGAFDSPQTAPAPRFSNVYADPGSVDSYMKTGSWPDRTIIVADKRAGATTMPITKGAGWGQTGASLGFEVAVKDRARGGWRYYTAGPGDAVATAVANQSDCTTCHREHGAVDSTFVQFYPLLLPVAQQHGTLRVR